MNRFRLLSLIFVISGIICFSLGIYFGEIRIGIFIVFPFLIGSGISAFLGFLFIFLSIVFYMFGKFKILLNNSDQNIDEGSEKKVSVKGGGVVLIGPIPIIFGSNWKIAVVMIILTIVLIVTWTIASNIL